MQAGHPVSRGNGPHPGPTVIILANDHTTPGKCTAVAGPGSGAIPCTVRAVTGQIASTNPLLISPEPGNLTSYSVARLIPGKESDLEWWHRRSG